MTLHCTLVSALPSGLDKRPLELTIEAPAGTGGTELLRHLARRFGTGDVSVQGTRLESLRVGTAPLVNGAVLVDLGGARPPLRKQLPRITDRQEAGLALAIHSGSGAGTLVSLTRGIYTLGRSGTRILVPDAEMSREHARLTVTHTGIFIEDLDSSNGTWVDGQRVRNAAVSTASRILCGTSAMSLVFTDDAPEPLAEAGSSVLDPISVTARTEYGNRMALVLTATLPLAIGVGLALMTGMWMFLAFAGASAVSVLIPLLTGRRQRRDTAAAVNAAVCQDGDRRRRAGPSLAALALGARRSAVREAAVCDGRAWLRLGLGVQPANITVQPASALRDLPSVGIAPVLLDPSRPETVFQGPRPVLDALIRALVMQLAGYPRGSQTRVLIHGETEFLPLASRFLPRVTLTATEESCRRHLTEPLPPECPNGVLILAGTSDDRNTGEALAATGVLQGWQVLRFTSPADRPAAADVELSEPESSFAQSGARLKFVPDLAPVQVFDTFCRRLAATTGTGEPDEGVPRACTLADLMDLSTEATALRWAKSLQTSELAVPLGRAAGAIRFWDVDRDGPHLLVAGTTGSGKSELLRTLVVSMALSHPPDQVNFLFVDFKGGSGLGPLAGLAHCVGLLTDLSANELGRTLISLRAEIRRREEALAAAKAPDLAAYRSRPDRAGSSLPHLVIIIDEFRMLVDDAPEVLRELMRLASIGRSLGIHLVMATQRPQGALTADIRANVTSSIALRMQSDMESMDVIGTNAAAGIGVDSPGRAFIARGTEPPHEFQAATLGPSGRTPRNGTVLVQPTAEHLTSLHREAAGEGADTPEQAAQLHLQLTRELWASQAGLPPRRPVAPPLPDVLDEPVEIPAPPAGARPAWSVELGAVDLPHSQCVIPLAWEPALHSHLAFVGSPASGAAEGLDLAVRRLLTHRNEAHCYFLDASGGLQHAAGHRRTGAHAGLHELRRAARILERLALELRDRLSRHGDRHTPLVLVISGWGSWVSAFRSGPLAWAEDLVQDLVRDGNRAAITVVISGERELATARLGGSLPNRLYFPAASSEDSRLGWPRMPPAPPVKGRAVAFGPVVGSEAAVCQLYEPATAQEWKAESCNGAGDPRETRPFRVESLPLRVASTVVRESAAEVREPSAGAESSVAATEPLPDRHLVGIGGDELSPVRLHLPPGGVFPILGHPGGGKTSSIRALENLNPGICWVRPAVNEAPDAFWHSLRSEPGAGTSPGGAVLVADDADRLSPSALNDLTELQSRGHTVLLTACYSPLLLQRLPLVLASRARGSGMLLAPRSTADGDIFGVRFEPEPGAPPGRAVLLSAGTSSAIQVAWVPPAGPRAVGRRS